MPLTKIIPSNLHTSVNTMVQTMVNENAIDSADATLIINSNIAAKDTDNISEGSVNLYYTDARADARAQLKVDALVGSAPGSLDTLQELGDALGDDPNFATTVTNSIATKLPLTGGTLTGNLTLTSTASGSSASPEFELRRDITGADANYIGQIKFTADNDADQNIVFAKITGKILDASDGTEDGIIEFAHKKAGSNNISARFRSDSLQLINGTNLTVAGTTELTGNLGIGATPSSAIGVYSTKSLANGLAAELTNTESSTGSGLVVKGGNNSSTYSADFRNYNNTTLMRIRGDGNVGIGTTSPSAPLTIGSGATRRGSYSDLLIAPGGDNAQIEMWGANTSFAISHFDNDRLGIYSNVSGSWGETRGINIKASNGNVGIGTTSPANKFVVAEGTGQHGVEIAPGTLSYIQAYDRATSDYGDLSIDAQTIRFATDNGTERMRIDESGNLLVGTTTNTHDRAKLTVFGAEGAPATSGTSTANVALRLATTSGNSQAMDLGIYNAAPYGGWIQASNSGGLSNTSPIAINPNGGNVGIGTSSPAHELDVVGTTKAEQYLLDGIDKSFTESGNVTHIFVYDTRHDTDGGAWRKKTKSTSWYTESLNTSTRGSRREFPVVAIIVATTTYTTIYDGDDPDTPMWMVYPDPCWASGGTPSKVMWAAMNGVLTWGSDNRGCGMMNMTNDHIHFFHGTNMYYKQYPLIKDRSDGSAKAITASGINMGYPTRHSTVNHIAITVPKTRVNIDPNSGLPKPIIGLATNSGACIISDDIVYDASENATCNMIMFHNDDMWFDRADYENMHVIRDIGRIGGEPISTSQVYYTTSGVYPQLMVGRTHGTTDVVNSNAMAGGEYPSFGNPNGLAMIAENWEQYPIRFNRGRVAHINHVYNTGWMQGFCRSATMMDTDSSDLDQTNIITAQGFSATTSGVINQGTVSLNPDKVYRLSVTTVGDVHMVWTQNQSSGVIAQTSNFGGLAMPGNATSTTFVTGVTGWNINSWHTGTISNYTITEAVADRTIYNRTYGTEGTINRSPVATGADIVAYHGFSAGNLLTCSDINTIGTSDFHFSFWMKATSVGSGSSGSYWHAVSLGTNTSFGQGRSTGFSFKMVTSTNQPGGDTGYSPYFYSANGNDNGTYSTQKKIPLGQWTMVTAGRVGTRWVIYVNGKWFHSGGTNAYNISDTFMSLGAPQSSSEFGGDAHMTMFRLSHDWPTDAQLLKTYQEEKELFRPGAQGTLYGTSKEVTALASDPDTGLLHVGTSSGRSVMRGLTRVDNTTTAVSTAIGASNGTVVEE